MASYIDAFNEYKLNNITAYAFSDAMSYDIFVKYDDYRNERSLKPNRVGADYYWLVDDEKDYFIGEVVVRHSLTESLLRYGGHIGYGVRFSEWGRGYGTLMLKIALEKAKAMGITRVLVTCDDDNPASSGVIEKNGMLLQDKVENVIDGKTVITRRYWKSL